jgi:hypothetical protein
MNLKLQGRNAVAMTAATADWSAPLADCLVAMRALAPHIVEAGGVIA